VEHYKLLFGLIAVLGAIFAVFWLISAWLGALTVGLPIVSPLENEIILEASVNNTNPLILTVNMKSLYYSDIEFDHGYIQNVNQTVVAQCPRTVPLDSVSDGRGHSVQRFNVCILPANSQRNVTLSFNTALPSGNYRLALNIRGYTIYSDYFTVY